MMFARSGAVPRKKLFENTSRMSGATAGFYFILPGVSGGQTKPLGQCDGVERPFYLRMFPRVYGTDADYMNAPLTESMRVRTTCNHENGAWGLLRRIMLEMARASGTWGKQLDTCMVPPHADVLVAGTNMSQLLLEVAMPGRCNAHSILAREAWDLNSGRLDQQLVAVRKAMFDTTLYGTDGLAGL